MAKVRKDNKGRNLRPGETQRADGSYMYVYKLGTFCQILLAPYLCFNVVFQHFLTFTQKEQVSLGEPA